jgi:hypothetical protein
LVARSAMSTGKINLLHAGGRQADPASSFLTKSIFSLKDEPEAGKESLGH